MQQNNATTLRSMLEGLPTEELDKMLNAELKKSAADADANAVRMILRVLEDREKDHPVVITPGIELAWKKYQEDIAQIDSGRNIRQTIKKWAVRIASAAAVFVLITMALPQKANAETLFERIARWTSEIVELFGTQDNNDRIVEYEFKSENAGLQKLYDAVVELGVTDPVVPMWLPDGSELLEIKMISLSKKRGVLARFQVGNTELVYKIDCYDTEYSHKYHKDETVETTKEIAGVIHNIVRNNNFWTVFWNLDTVECFITIDCQEDILFTILKSIYSMEDI